MFLMLPYIFLFFATCSLIFVGFLILDFLGWLLIFSDGVKVGHWKATVQILQKSYTNIPRRNQEIIWGTSHPGWPQKRLIGNSRFNSKT